ncbi:MAG TPA: nucleotide exchange factor GrpE [Nitrososphaeraceae archaeon]|nr:nucleotide exchange factor GrpE [Nitrososphaeraceae archaeon]
MGLEDSNIKEGSEEEKQNGNDELDVGRPADNDDRLDNKVELFQLREDLRKARDSADDSLNKLRYMVADFDNYRKQTEKQVSSKIEASRAEILLKFLNIRDDYLRALNIIKHDKPDAVIIEGLQGILKNFDNLLSSEGVIEIESVGTPFDPNIHDALNFSYSDRLPENTVTNEIRKGYMYNNKVLRPSLVEISKKIVKNTVNATETLEKDSDV